MRALWNDDDPMVQEIDGRIEELLRNRDKDKPARVRINVLDRRMAAAQKKVEAKVEEERELEKKLAGLVEERSEKVGQLNAAKQAVKKLKAEHTEELQRALGEGKEKAEGANGAMDAEAAVAVLRKETIARLPKDNPGVGEAIDKAFAQLISLMAGLPREPAQTESGNTKEGGGQETEVHGGSPGARRSRRNCGDWQRAARRGTHGHRRR